MDAIDALLSRRSIRKYKNKKVSDSKIKELLEVAMSAPSAGNQQLWHFIVIKDPHTLGKIPSFHNHAQMIKDASFGILVCGDINLEKYKDMWIQDCAAATENILIAVNAEGLGGVWLGIYPRDERIKGLRELLDIPENIIPFSLISIGYPAEKKPKSNRYNNSRVHFEKW